MAIHFSTAACCVVSSELSSPPTSEIRVSCITSAFKPSHTGLLRGHRGMNTSLQRGLLGFLAVTGAVTGLWAYVAPRNWYDTFPGMGLSWLPQLGPYNEHFAKDVGA